MTYAVYEVEIEPIIEGQRFCQHIKAASPEEAAEKVAAIQGRKVLGVTVRRECLPQELAALEAAK